MYKPLISGSYSGMRDTITSLTWRHTSPAQCLYAIEMGLLRFASSPVPLDVLEHTVEKAIRGGAQNYGDNYM